MIICLHINILYRFELFVGSAKHATLTQRDDPILRLCHVMKNRHTYDKVFQKIWGVSGKKRNMQWNIYVCLWVSVYMFDIIILCIFFQGGWAVIACTHGIVYSLKFNLRAESPQDFTDLLMSWKHLPNVYFKHINDFCFYCSEETMETSAEQSSSYLMPVKSLLSSSDSGINVLFLNLSFDKLFFVFCSIMTHVIYFTTAEQDLCGIHCEAFTKYSNIKACQTSWTLGCHHGQKQLV